MSASPVILDFEVSVARQCASADRAGSATTSTPAQDKEEPRIIG
jgi:hypothetical protein